MSFGQGEGTARGRAPGRGRAGAGRLAESLGPRRPPLRPLGHHRALRGAGGPGAGYWPPRPHESAPPPPPEPRRQQGPDRPRIAQRLGGLGGPARPRRWSPVAPRQRSASPSSAALPPPPSQAPPLPLPGLAPAGGLGGRSSAAATAEQGQPQGRGCAPLAELQHHRCRWGPHGRAESAAVQLARPGSYRAGPLTRDGAGLRAQPGERASAAAAGTRPGSALPRAARTGWGRRGRR